MPWWNGGRVDPIAQSVVTMSLLGTVSWIFIKIHSQIRIVLVLVQICFSILDYYGLL